MPFGFRYPSVLLDGVFSLRDSRSISVKVVVLALDIIVVAVKFCAENRDIFRLICFEPSFRKYSRKKNILSQKQK